MMPIQPAAVPNASLGFSGIVLLKFTPGGHSLYYFTNPIDRIMMLLKVTSRPRHNMGIYR